MHYEVQDLLDASILARTRPLLFTPDAKTYQLVKGSAIQDSQFSLAAHFDQTSKEYRQERSGKHSRPASRNGLIQENVHFTGISDPRISTRATAKFYPSLSDERTRDDSSSAMHNDSRHTSEAPLQLISVDTADAQLSFIERMLQSRPSTIPQANRLDSAEDPSSKRHADQYKQVREDLHSIEKRFSRSSSNESDATSLIGLHPLVPEALSMHSLPYLHLHSQIVTTEIGDFGMPLLSLSSTPYQEECQAGVPIHENESLDGSQEPLLLKASPTPSSAEVVCTDDAHHAMRRQASLYDEDQGWGRRPQKTLDWSETGPQGTMKEDLRARHCSIVSTATWSTRDEIRIRRDQAAWAAGELAMDSTADRVSKWLVEVDSTML